jgi:hypothetical protein
MTPMLPFAALDFGETIKILVAVVFIVITILNKVLSANKEAKPAAKKPPVPREVPPVPNVRKAQQDEIDAFLRRAADNLKPKKQTARQTTRPAPPKSPPQTPKKTPPRRLVEIKQDLQPLQPMEPLPRESVATHVQKHLSNAEFEARAAHLTDDLLTADQQREQHRQEVFGHRVGTLADTSVSGSDLTEQPATTAAQSVQVTTLAGVLASPDAIRRAIVLSEILERPEHRWSS